MCIQSYYNTENYELELDLLGEIKKVGIDKWQKKVKQELEHDPKSGYLRIRKELLETQGFKKAKTR